MMPTLSPGTLLGPYQIKSAIGAGGMGEVYRAHDTRLGRDVAIKVLGPHLTASPEARARFEREARTISRLTHPHICTLHDIGREGDTDYLVMELLEGQTLAHRLEKGPLPMADVLALGAQIADALDQAHRAGVVHRDLKPGNVMLTKSGAKLMDFGLARAAGPGVTGGAAHAAAGRSSMGLEGETATASLPLTAEGAIVGTFQYMAPEQLEGKEADARTDIWALGCVLYEMATGKRASEGTSQASLIAAILEHEPPSMMEGQPLTPPALEHLVKRCLEKDADKRWQSAADLAHDLEWIAGGGSQEGAPIPSGSRSRRVLGSRTIAAIAVAAAVLAMAVFLAGRLAKHRPEHPTFTRLTFQRGIVGNARFAPDGKSVVYSAAWDGRPTEIFEARTDLSSTRLLGLPGAWLHAVSRTGDLALGRNEAWYNFAYGPLAIAPASGSAPRDLLEDVSQADWTPDGGVLAIVRRVNGEERLEMPPGHVLARTAGMFNDLRVSPDGRHIAFAEHSVMTDWRGEVGVVDASGRKMLLTGEFANVFGLAWRPDGREIWFSATISGGEQSLFAVTLKGQLRTVTEFLGSVVLKDVASDGRVLLTSRRIQTGIRGASLADGKERELGWLDFPWPRALSVDGRRLLFDDEGETAGKTYTVYLRSMDGALPVRLGQGSGRALSPDGQWALALRYGAPPRLVLIPTGSGDTLSLPPGSVETYQEDASWLSDGRRIVYVGAEQGRPQRTWVQELPDGLPRPVTPEGTTGAVTSPDGRWVAAVAPDSTLMLFPLQEGEPRSVGKLAGQEEVSQWSADGRTLFVSRRGVRLRVCSIDIQSEERQPWKSIEVPDPAGVLVWRALITPDERSYAYGYLRFLDELYLVEGLR